jgi:putative flippase GtrA
VAASTPQPGSPAAPEASSPALAPRVRGETFGRFALVGGVKAAIDFATFNLVLLAAPDSSRAAILLANTLGFTASSSIGFVLHGRFTFDVPAGERGFLRYILVSLVALTIYNGTLAALIELGGFEGRLLLNVAKAAAVIVSMGANYLGYRYLVFHDRGASPRTGVPPAR